jgi:hypothetical protein
MLLVYDLTVLVATYIRAAISRFDRPAAINPKTSRSRPLRESSTGRSRL